MAETVKPEQREEALQSEELARTVWLLMSDLVLDNARRRHVSEKLGVSFARVRALRRLAQAPMSMGELASLLGIDPPNATVVVEECEELCFAGLHRKIIGLPA